MLPSKPLPLIVAARNAHSWEQVLEAYTQCSRYLEGVYTPSNSELRYGISQMSTSWSTSLFYYSVIKGTFNQSTPHPSVVAAVIQKYRQQRNVPCMKRVFEEDMNALSSQGTSSALVLACYSGMWESALKLFVNNPTLSSSLASRRFVINALSYAGKWEAAMTLLDDPLSVDASPDMIRPIVAHLSFLGEHDAVMRLTARSLACGYTFSTSLLAALMTSLRARGDWRLALQVAQDQGVFSATRSSVQRNIALYNKLVQCLYEMNLYSNFTVPETVADVSARMNPRDISYRAVGRKKQFRLLSQADVYQRYSGILFSFGSAYGKAISIPHWYSRNLTIIVDAALERKALVLVIDTNFLIQCVSKNLPLEHFYEALRRQHPESAKYSFATVVVPFTTLMEAYTLIWDTHNRMRHSVRLLLWSRVITFLRHPNVYALSLTAEFPCSSFSIVSRMAYSKLGESVAGNYDRDPDLRILNVCLSLQHAFRLRRASALTSQPIPEGMMLFAFMKYHVRRYNNTVKGPVSDQLLLCTLDRRLSIAAREAGVATFPLHTH